KWIPPAVPILVTAAIAWYLHRQISLVVFVIAALLLILNLGYWQEMLETFVLVFAATTISVLIGVPLGIIAAHRPWLYTLMRPILDLMQTVPTFVYLIPTLVLFGLGIV
ncbi:ABC transporter permease subunit, partial [Vibrio anguillarum]|uniref:ABC transporter permease subunit n=1 Tax=Vibrio anguillarum TaxID=55601 RepID=UPI001C05E367